jgi:hypothetical protein
MSTDPSVSVQAQVRPGRAVDLYYMDEETALKQAIPTLVNTRFKQDFTNKSQGSSTFIIPPQNGVNQVIAVFKWAGKAQIEDCSGLALPRAWGYSALQSISVRYGGSAQYFFSGSQVLQRALRQCPSGTARDQLLTLGGNLAADTDLLNDQYAYVFLDLPHSATTVDGVTTTTVPTDLLNQQIVITAVLNPATSYMSRTGDPSDASIATNFASLDEAYFQVQQTIMDDQQDSLARRVDMNTHFYTLPLPSFDQQELIIRLQNSAIPQNQTLTGFRNGQLRSIQMWITKDSDTSGDVKNPWKWYRPGDLQVIYGGTVYADYGAGSSALWNLLNGRLSSSANNVDLAVVNDAFVESPVLQEWVSVPFAQPHLQESTTDVLVNGLEVRNGIINVVLRTPTAASDYNLHVVYVYNASLMFSKATCDYVF